MRGIKIIYNGSAIHTGNDLDLVQEIKTIDTPSVQSYQVEVPGRNGLLDLTKGLTGSTCYNNRELQFQYFGSGKRDRLLELRDTFNRYHGERIQIIDDDTPDYYYDGVAEMSSELHGTYITLSLTVDADPFRKSVEPILVRKDLTSAPMIVEIYNPGVESVPKFYVETDARIVKDGVTTYLGAGTYTLPKYALSRGNNRFTVSGSGSLVIGYKEAII